MLEINIKNTEKGVIVSFNEKAIWEKRHLFEKANEVKLILKPFVQESNSLKVAWILNLKPGLKIETIINILETYFPKEKIVISSF